MEEMLQEVVKEGKLHASTTPEVSDAYFMVVPTPFKDDHELDIVVFLTDHDPFKTLEYREDKLILDLCGIF